MRRLLPLALVCLILGACGTATGGSVSGESATAPGSAPATPRADQRPPSQRPESPGPDSPGGTAAGDTVPEALQFRAETLGGRAFEGADLAGQPAVLWFWAPWCPTCRAQAPGVNALAQAHAGEVSVVGVGGLDDTAAMQDFATGVDDVVTLIADDEGAVWRRFRVTEQSSYVVLDARGDTVASGYLDDAELRALVDDLAG